MPRPDKPERLSLRVWSYADGAQLRRCSYRVLALQDVFYVPPGVDRRTGKQLHLRKEHPALAFFRVTIVEPDLNRRVRRRIGPSVGRIEHVPVAQMSYRSIVLPGSVASNVAAAIPGLRIEVRDALCRVPRARERLCGGCPPLDSISVSSNHGLA